MEFKWRKRIMNDIINDVNELKENILKSSEYLNFKNSEKNLIIIKK